MENSLKLNDFHIKQTNLIVNRIHIFFHGIALLSLFYYRIKSILTNNAVPFLPYSLLFISELILSFIWFLSQASKWKPITRNVYIKRLPENERLPSIDVFICTADPDKEPSVEVMNTVISAMAMDYPFDKFNVYISDDGGSLVTFRAVQEAWKFSRFWIPFCRKYEVENRCPNAYFLKQERNDDIGMLGGNEFAHEKKIIEQKYKEFKDDVMKIIANTTSSSQKDHPPILEVVNDANGNGLDSCKEEMPLLVYISREKRPSYPHHFKAGALNVLLRVSAMISNSPYILVLDCDMYCNDPTSARQAMCFHLDSKLSQKLAFVQFPQRFHTISETDIIDAQIRWLWERWEGLDGLKGPILSGTGFYIKRKALYGTDKIHQDFDHIKLRRWYGSSYEFIKSMYTNYQPNYATNVKFSNTLLNEMQLLASCTYDEGTKWGKEVGFRYFSVVEDYFTGFNLHCEGWNSVYINPTRPCFLGASPICLNDTLVQHTRWFIGLMQVALSRFSPVLYGPFKMSILQSMCYGEFAFTAIYFIPLYALAIIPQLCLICGLPLYPKVSSPFFLLFTFIFLSSQIKQIQDIFLDGHSINVWWIEQRMWMMKSTTCYFYATLNTILEKIGLTKSSFVPTNKVVDDEQDKRYRLGIYDFQTSALFLVPLCSLYILNMACFIIGIVRILITQKGDEMFIQAFIPLFGMIVNYPLLEGMVLRKDKGRILPSISIISAVISLFVLCLFSVVAIY